MSIITPPSLQGIGVQDAKGNSLHVVNCAYDFDGDPVTDVQLGALQFAGSSYAFDPASLSNSGLGSIKSVGFSASFAGTGTDISAGTLFFYSQASQQLIALSPPAMPGALSATAPAPNAVRTMSGVFSLVAHKISKLIIAKAVDQTSQGLTGTVFLSLYDFVVPPFITSGYGEGMPI